MVTFKIISDFLMSPIINFITYLDNDRDIENRLNEQTEHIQKEITNFKDNNIIIEVSNISVNAIPHQNIWDKEVIPMIMPDNVHKPNRRDKVSSLLNQEWFVTIQYTVKNGSVYDLIPKYIEPHHATTMLDFIDEDKNMISDNEFWRIYTVLCPHTYDEPVIQTRSLYKGSISKFKKDINRDINKIEKLQGNINRIALIQLIDIMKSYLSESNTEKEAKSKWNNSEQVSKLIEFLSIQESDESWYLIKDNILK